jgi:small subunit ribosomal protein S3
MGQKVNPYGFRLGVTTDWKSRWFAKDKAYTDNLIEDWKIRDYLMNKLPNAAISRIEVERTTDRLRVDVHTARPGIVIGKKGAGVDQLRAEIQKFSSSEILLNIIEVKNAEANTHTTARPPGIHPRSARDTRTRRCGMRDSLMM